MGLQPFHASLSLPLCQCWEWHQHWTDACCKFLTCSSWAAELGWAPWLKFTIEVKCKWRSKDGVTFHFRNLFYFHILVGQTFLCLDLFFCIYFRPVFSSIFWKVLWTGTADSVTSFEVSRNLQSLTHYSKLGQRSYIPLCLYNIALRDLDWGLWYYQKQKQSGAK